MVPVARLCTTPCSRNGSIVPDISRPGHQAENPKNKNSQPLCPRSAMISKLSSSAQECKVLGRRHIRFEYGWICFMPGSQNVERRSWYLSPRRLLFIIDNSIVLVETVKNFQKYYPRIWNSCGSPSRCATNGYEAVVCQLRIRSGHGCITCRNAERRSWYLSPCIVLVVVKRPKASRNRRKFEKTRKSVTEKSEKLK